MSNQPYTTHYPPSTWRILHTSPFDGALNMAVDEAILNAVADGRSPPTLRFFAWTPPCLSLGYAQPMSDVDVERLAARGWGLVRRPTGGRAILHTDELTYSVIAPMDEPRVLGGVTESYRQLSTGLLRGLECIGLNANADKKEKPQSRDHLTPHSQNPVCFEVPSDYEITAGGKKLLGSAQVRKRGVVLQHGTLPLTGEISRICDALRFNSDDEREQVRQRVRSRATTMGVVLGREVSWETAAAAMQHGFAEALELKLEKGKLTTGEWADAQRLGMEKYATEGWNARL
ncbi:MAG: lipoate--protein ligase family protein [Anaerolineales bacterium]